MARACQIVFASSLLALCWLVMMVAHEFGHVIGAVITGGSVRRVVLHPIAISRTDVSPNPQPAIVVWMGPIIGCALPLLLASLVPERRAAVRNIAKFYAGFCLVANGAYIAIGSFESVGDAGVMLATGSPRWLLLAFGAATVPLGMFIWHRLGSLGEFLKQPSLVTRRLAGITVIVLVVLTAVELCLSPR